MYKYFYIFNLLRWDNKIELIMSGEWQERFVLDGVNLFDVWKVRFRVASKIDFVIFKGMLVYSLFLSNFFKKYARLGNYAVEYHFFVKL